jgi:hypothetical protein
MTIESQTQKHDWDETFQCVMELYTTLQEGRDGLRVKPVAHPQADGEVETAALDFLMDVELKAKHSLPYLESQMFTRVSQAGNFMVLPSEMKTFLGRIFTEYGLGLDGAYRKLYFKTKNAQIRQALRGPLNGRCVE